MFKSKKRIGFISLFLLFYLIHSDPHHAVVDAAEVAEDAVVAAEAAAGDAVAGKLSTN